MKKSHLDLLAAGRRDCTYSWLPQSAHDVAQVVLEHVAGGESEVVLERLVRREPNRARAFVFVDLNVGGAGDAYDEGVPEVVVSRTPAAVADDVGADGVDELAE